MSTMRGTQQFPLSTEAKGGGGALALALAEPRPPNPAQWREEKAIFIMVLHKGNRNGSQLTCIPSERGQDEPDHGRPTIPTCPAALEAGGDPGQ